MINFIKRCTLNIVVSAVSLGCTNFEYLKMNKAKENVIIIADTFVKNQYPNFIKSSKIPVVVDKNNTWEIIYLLPDGDLGGAPIIYIDKTSNLVIKHYMTQ